MLRMNMTKQPKQDNSKTKKEKQQPPTNGYRTRNPAQDNTAAISIESEYAGIVIGNRRENRQRVQANTKHQ